MHLQLLEETGMSSRAIEIGRDAGAAIRDVRRSTGLQLLGMEAATTDRIVRDRLRSIAACVDERLTTISALTRSGQIAPFRRIALAEGDAPDPTEDRCMRIGVYPVAADPLHWGHILVGLTAMALMVLDKVVFVIAGADSRKPSMGLAVARHRLGRSVIERFDPVFEYSSLALGTDVDGETSFERLLLLNSRQRMEAFYIAGADHYRRTTEQGKPDTIRKLERIAVRQARDRRTLHGFSAVFVEREGTARHGGEVRTSLRIHVLPPPIPFALSSSAARQALRQGAFSEALAALPYTSLPAILASELFAGST